MKTLLVTILCLALTGCASFHEGMARAERQQQAALDYKASVLSPGASEAAIRDAWGEPRNVSNFVGVTGRISTLQYGQCAASRSVTSGVIFITVINGRFASYYVTQC